LCARRTKRCVIEMGRCTHTHIRIRHKEDGGGAAAECVSYKFWGRTREAVSDFRALGDPSPAGRPAQADSDGPSMK
jgi:hypothetical protein